VLSHVITTGLSPQIRLCNSEQIYDPDEGCATDLRGDSCNIDWSDGYKCKIK